MMKKRDADPTAQIEQLQREVDSLRSAFSVFEALAMPRMAKLYQEMVGGLVAVASNSDWRMHGFFPPEENLAWTQFDLDAGIQMLLLKGDRYECALRLVQTPHIAARDGVVVKVGGKKMQPVYDEEEQAYSFEFHAQRTGWHDFTFNSRECLQPSLSGSHDIRRLGVLFRSLTLVPIVD